MNLSVELAPRSTRELTLRNPVMAASGTFGYGLEYAGLVDLQRLGAIICKGITRQPRRGNPAPRLAETPSGLLNAIGLQNIGVEKLVRDYAPLWTTWEAPVVVNIAGETVGEYGEIASILDEVPGVAGLEVNISCPNLAAGGLAFGVEAHSAARVTKAVRESTTLPVIVKLSPNVTDIREIAIAVEDAGADAISLINTLLGMTIDVKKRRPLLANITGGLSGPAVRPVAVRMVYQVAQAVKVPVVGLGGIRNVSDALEFLMAGATAVQVGTATFTEPGAMVDIITGLQSWLASEGIEEIRDIVGAALKKG